jgi:hypothetical protein
MPSSPPFLPMYLFTVTSRAEALQRQVWNLMETGALTEAHALSGRIFRTCGKAGMQGQAVTALLLIANVHRAALNYTGALPYLLSCLLHAGKHGLQTGIDWEGMLHYRVLVAAAEPCSFPRWHDNKHLDGRHVLNICSFLLLCSGCQPGPCCCRGTAAPGPCLAAAQPVLPGAGRECLAPSVQTEMLDPAGLSDVYHTACKSMQPRPCPLLSLWSSPRS